MQQIVDKMVYSLSAPTNKNVVWVKPTGNGTFEMRIYDNNTWVPLSSSGSGGSGSGIDIVDSIDKLDPNAELGSIASVAVQGNLVETSIRNLYQPDASMLDPDVGILTQPELLSSVSSIKVFAPTDTTNIWSEIVESPFYLVPRDFSMTNQVMAMVDVSIYGVLATIMADGPDTMQEFVLVEYTQFNDGFLVHNDQVEAFNAILANGKDWCYLGNPETGFVITEEQFNTLDLFVNAVSWSPAITDVYIKKDNWEPLHKKDLNIVLEEMNIVTDTLSTKANLISVNSSSSLGGSIHPNTYYKQTCSHKTYITYYLERPIDTSVYSEYIIQLTCEAEPYSVKFQDTDYNDLPIKWANDMEPTFIGGYTYIISIVDNLGVFAQYVNS